MMILIRGLVSHEYAFIRSLAIALYLCVNNHEIVFLFYTKAKKKTNKHIHIVIRMYIYTDRSDYVTKKN